MRRSNTRLGFLRFFLSSSPSAALVLTLLLIGTAQAATEHTDQDVMEEVDLDALFEGSDDAADADASAGSAEASAPAIALEVERQPWLALIAVLVLLPVTAMFVPARRWRRRGGLVAASAPPEPKPLHDQSSRAA